MCTHMHTHAHTHMHTTPTPTYPCTSTPTPHPHHTTPTHPLIPITHSLIHSLTAHSAGGTGDAGTYGVEPQSCHWGLLLSAALATTLTELFIFLGSPVPDLEDCCALLASQGLPPAPGSFIVVIWVGHFKMGLESGDAISGWGTCPSSGEQGEHNTHLFFWRFFAIVIFFHFCQEISTF